MPTIKNASPFGDLDVPLLRRIVKGGETVTVTEDQAARLLPQDIWEAVDKSAKAIQSAIDQPISNDDPAPAEEAVTA